MPLDLAGERVAVSASIGIAVYPHDGDNRQALLQAADTAMYSAKAQGKNRICFYAPDMHGLPGCGEGRNRAAGALAAPGGTTSELVRIMYIMLNRWRKGEGKEIAVICCII